MYKILLRVCLLLAVVLAKHELYDGHSLYQITVKNADQAKFVSDIENLLNLDIWSDAVPERPGSVLVKRELKKQFEDALKAADVEYKISVDNIKEALDQEDKLMAESKVNRSSNFPFDAIHSYDVIMDYIEHVANSFPHIVNLESAGKSSEGRDIKYLKVSSSRFQDESKPVVIIESLLHCREWIGLSVSLYAIRKLVIEAAENDLLNRIDWIIVPIVNPDGFEWTFTNGRMWRKNRARGFITGDICMGVDLNRNFDIHWGTASSSSVCTDTFHGRAPLSEPESQAVRDIILEHRHRLALFLDIHSYGSMILYGYGDGVLPPNGLLLHVNGVNMATVIDRLKWVNKPNYTVGNIKAILYDASGGASDYAQHVGAEYSYTYELPAFNNQQGFNGFLVDPAFIEQAGYETWEGIKVGAEYAARTFQSKRNQN